MAIMSEYQVGEDFYKKKNGIYFTGIGVLFIAILQSGRYLLFYKEETEKLLKIRILIGS